MHRQTISRHLTSAGIKLRAKTRRLIDTQVAEAADRYQAGATLAQLAAHYGVGQETIRRELHQAGVELRPRGGRHS